MKIMKNYGKDIMWYSKFTNGRKRYIQPENKKVILWTRQCRRKNSSEEDNVILTLVSGAWGHCDDLNVNNVHNSLYFTA